MKIVIGLEDSPCSQAAVDRVKQMAWPAGTRAVVLSVVRPIVSAFVGAYVPGPDVYERVETEQTQLFRELARDTERQLNLAGIATEGRVVAGDPREAIVETARSLKADLVVVGSHGWTGLKGLVLGSVAQYVVSHAPCDVLVVKRPGGEAGRSGPG